MTRDEWDSTPEGPEGSPVTRKRSRYVGGPSPSGVVDSAAHVVRGEGMTPVIVLLLAYIAAILIIFTIAAAIADFAGYLWPEWEPGDDD